MKVFLAVFTILALSILVSCSGEAPKTAEEKAAPATETMGKAQKVTLQVSGMTCENCVSAVDQALAACEGVSEHSVSLAENKAEVAFDPQKADPEKLIAAIEKAGFKAQLATAEQ